MRIRKVTGFDVAGADDSADGKHLQGVADLPSAGPLSFDMIKWRKQYLHYVALLVIEGKSVTSRECGRDLLRNLSGAGIVCSVRTVFPIVGYCRCAGPVGRCDFRNRNRLSRGHFGE